MQRCKQPKKTVSVETVLPFFWRSMHREVSVSTVLDDTHRCLRKQLRRCWANRLQSVRPKRCWHGTTSLCMRCDWPSVPEEEGLSYRHCWQPETLFTNGKKTDRLIRMTICCRCKVRFGVSDVTRRRAVDVQIGLDRLYRLQSEVDLQE